MVSVDKIAKLAMAHAVMWLAACAPPPLEPPPRDASQTVVSDFPKVAGILTNNCVSAGCHGKKKDLGATSSNFYIKEGQWADDKQVRAALEGKTLPNSGAKLIVPNKPGESVIFQSLIESNGRVLMPTTGKLPDRKIEVIRRWIAKGAPYE